jgi:hypothetical protein
LNPKARPPQRSAGNHGATSTMVISRLPTDQWYSGNGDNTLADAILNRLMHNAHRLQLKGEIMRTKNNLLTQNGRIKKKRFVMRQGNSLFILDRNNCSTSP